MSDSAYQRLITALETHGCVVRHRGTEQASAQCPAHDDGNPSLSLRAIEGQALVYCHAQCETEQVLGALGWQMADLYDDREGYRYRYDDGRTVHRRYEGNRKAFVQYGQKRGRITLFRKTAVEAAVQAGRPVRLVEGEKDVLAVESAGEVATSAPQGASNVHLVDPAPLHGADVVAVVDQDEAGQQWARSVRSLLHGVARSLEFRAPAAGKDAADHIAAGHPLSMLRAFDPFAEQDPAEKERAEAEEARRMDFERRVETEVDKLRVRDEARRRHRKQAAAASDPPAIVALDEFLSVEDPPQRYRVDALWPLGGRVMLAAQFKAGKTTLVGNLARSLVDSEPFLGRHSVDPPRGRVVIIDDELDERMVRSWLRDQGIANTGQAAVLPLRGKVSTFDILDADVRSQWAAALRQAGAEIVILDCLAPIVDALGLSEDKEVGRLLVAFDELLGEAGVQEAVVVHHMGHSGERTRGASRLRDWPDVEWRLVREKSDDGETDPAAPRYFSAYGRDVDVREAALSFDAATRRLTLGGSSRKSAKQDRALDDVLVWLADNPAASKNQVEAAMQDTDHERAAVRSALKKGVSGGWITTVRGARNSVMHWAAESPREVDEDQSASSPHLAATSPQHPGAETGLDDVSAGQSTSPTSPREIGLSDVQLNSTSPDYRRTETPAQEANDGQFAAPRRDLAANSGATSPVRPPMGGGELANSGAPTRLRVVGETVIDADTGEIRDPPLTPCAADGCRSRINPARYTSGHCETHGGRDAGPAAQGGP